MAWESGETRIYPFSTYFHILMLTRWSERKASMQCSAWCHYVIQHPTPSLCSDQETGVVEKAARGEIFSPGEE